MSWLIVKSQGGRIVLRIEDLDIERSKPQFADMVQRDFEFLGLTWDEGPYFQQGNSERYAQAFDELASKGLVYPCFCTRASLKAASAPHWGEKQVYPGFCRNLTQEERMKRMEERDPAWRLRVSNESFGFDDLVQGHYSQCLDKECGDFVVRRSDGLFAYQLASVIDDGDQHVNCVVRGVDLITSTPQQMYLQKLLGIQPCIYAHVPLLVAERNRRLSKRDKDAGIDELKRSFGSAAGIIGHIAYVVGLQQTDEPATCEDLLKEFNCASLNNLFSDNIQIPWT